MLSLRYNIKTLRRLNEIFASVLRRMKYMAITRRQLHNFMIAMCQILKRAKTKKILLKFSPVANMQRITAPRRNPITRTCLCSTITCLKNMIQLQFHILKKERATKILHDWVRKRLVVRRVQWKESQNYKTVSVTSTTHPAFLYNIASIRLTLLAGGSLSWVLKFFCFTSDSIHFFLYMLLRMYFM